MFFLGRLPRTKISEVYENMDCFVLASESETFGVVYIEAMAAGLPVIATICGGPENFVTEEVGYLIERDNKDELIQSMLRIIREKTYFHEGRIREYVNSRFSPRHVAERLVELYSSILEEDEHA